MLTKSPLSANILLIDYKMYLNVPTCTWKGSFRNNLTDFWKFKGRSFFWFFMYLRSICRYIFYFFVKKLEKNFKKEKPLKVPILRVFQGFGLWSCWRDLNPWPLPYQGSALPTVPQQRIKFFGIIFGLGFSLPRWCSTYWAITACAKYWVVFANFSAGFWVSTKSYQGGALPTEP